MGKNYLGDVLDSSTDQKDIEECKVQYDTHAKRVLADITVLAWILKHSIKEMKDYSVEEIKTFIRGEPEISVFPVEPGKRKRSEAQAIHGGGGEDNVPGEGTIYYDIRFVVLFPDKEWAKMYINLEAQREYRPGYSILSRAIYYVSRMVSSQKGVEFVNSNYDDIKKVYSIWLCMDAPGKVQNSIIRYEMQPDVIEGVDLEDHRYDLISIVVICLGEQESNANSLLGMLNTLFSEKINIIEKKRILKSEYAIETSEKLEKEVSKMSNLGEWMCDKMYKKAYKEVYDKATSDGLKEGRRRAKLEGMREGKLEGMCENAENLFRNGVSYDVIRASISKEFLSDEELKKIQESVTCTS